MFILISLTTILNWWSDINEIGEWEPPNIVSSIKVTQMMAKIVKIIFFRKKLTKGLQKSKESFLKKNSWILVIAVILEAF